MQTGCHERGPTGFQNAFQGCTSLPILLCQVQSPLNKLREMSPLWEMYKEGIDLNTIEWAAH